MEDAIMQDKVSAYSPKLTPRGGQTAVYMRGELNINLVKRVMASNMSK